MLDAPAIIRSAEVSKYGVFVCDKATFLKLKALYKRYWQEVYDLAAYFRWVRKTVHQPPVTERIARFVGSGRTRDRNTVARDPKDLTKGYRWVKTIPEHVNDHGIVAAYQQARRCWPEDQVTPLSLPVEEIDKLLGLSELG